MNRRQEISIVALAAIALAVSYWIGYVHGSSFVTRQDMFVSVALPIIFIWTLVKLTFVLFFRRDGVPPASGGSQPPTAPSPDVPVPRPPGGPPEIYCEHAA
jgi:FtsH-binding integral membrane protein